MRFHRALVSVLVGGGTGMMGSNAAGTAQCQERKEYLGEYQGEEVGFYDVHRGEPTSRDQVVEAGRELRGAGSPTPVRFSAIAIRVRPDAVFKKFGARLRMSLALLCVPSRRATIGQFADQAPATRFPPSLPIIGPV